MSQVFIIGAAGQIGKRLVPRLHTAGHTVCGMHRGAEQADTIQSLGGKPVQGDLQAMSVAELADAMQGSDTVVFSAGAGGRGMDLTRAIDGKGLEKAVDAATIAGVRRFVLVSVFPDALRGGETSEGFENYIRIKKAADAYLVDSALDWLIVRPGTLLDDPGTGRIRANAALPYGDVPRDDVASLIAALIDEPRVTRQIIELTSGDTPIEDALDQLARRG
ncbi:MAG: SDR family oxidoreductase [Nitrosospira sp.]|nr:SDR family oxidoreductase [Nitrosospira sp.]